MGWITAETGDCCDYCGDEMNEGDDIFEDHNSDRCCQACYEDNQEELCEAQNDPDSEHYLIDGVGFADPGGNSALRAATEDNPRDRPCPTCGRENVLTRIDEEYHYQCNRCADAAERGF